MTTTNISKRQKSKPEPKAAQRAFVAPTQNETSPYQSSNTNNQKKMYNYCVKHFIKKTPVVLYSIQMPN